MSTITVAREIETARERVSADFEALRPDMTAHFWEGFGEAAAAYRRARNEGTAAREFDGTVNSLMADARGTANNPELRRGAYMPRGHAVPETDADAREFPPLPSRAPWATMPTDGSGRMNPAERILYAVTGTLCIAVLLIMGFLVSGAGSSPDAPDAGDSRSAARTVNDADMITQGGYWSWRVADGCAQGPARCHAVLGEVNAEAAPYGLKVWEDGSISPLGN